MKPKQYTNGVDIIIKLCYFKYGKLIFILQQRRLK